MSPRYDYLRDPQEIYRRSFETLRAESALQGLPAGIATVAERLRQHSIERAAILASGVRESIRSVLISAGHDDDVTFIDGSGEGEHRVRVIKKKVEIAK